MDALEQARDDMVEQQIASRGVSDRRVLAAMRQVPRERFLPPELLEFAYHDVPLPIAEQQTISQPYVVALMAEALGLTASDRVLEVGTGSGYAAAVMASLAREVYTIERHPTLADDARRRLGELGFANVEVRCGDGTLGWPEHAPYDAIVVAAGGPAEPPPALLAQLAIGGRLVIPVGPTPREQILVRVTRHGRRDYRTEQLTAVRFVPLIGEQGWTPSGADAAAAPRGGLPALLRESCLPFDDLEHADLGTLIERIGDARVVLLGEASHGTSEFYRMRARITRELILRHGFGGVAVEADWPDAAEIDRYVRHLPSGPRHAVPFSRFPTWMWRNREVAELTEWLREYNREVAAPRRASFHGLDLYSMYTSVQAVIGYLEGVDPAAAEVARERYGCLTPYQGDPAVYGRAVLQGAYQSCEREAVRMLRELLAKRLEYSAHDGERFFDAASNARLVLDAERYYRIMYRGSVESWNLRDQHMFDTLAALLEQREGRKLIVWAHNSHIGDASATEMGGRGEHNIGQLCRQAFGERAFLIGFGTHQGTVAAASAWDAPMQVMAVRPSHAHSYERLCHQTGLGAFLLHLRDPERRALHDALSEPRLERAIGVIYRPDSELASHYFQAVLPAQFDAYLWFDDTRAITPLAGPVQPGLPETYPFAV